MAGGHEPYDDESLKGLSRHFNNKTIKGRAHVSMATMSLIALYVVYKKCTKKAA